MVRLADMYHGRLTTRRAMKQRAEVYSYTMPHTLIDTDGQFNFSSMEHVSELMADQMKLGIPTVYNGKLIRQRKRRQHEQQRKQRRRAKRLMTLRLILVVLVLAGCGFGIYRLTGTTGEPIQSVISKQPETPETVPCGALISAG